MDKYDQTLHRVINETDEGILKWDAVNPASYSNIIVNADRVIRCFRAELTLKAKKYPLLFIEQKTFQYDDFGNEFEGLSFELYVLDEQHNLVFPIYDGLVDRNDLATLANTISDASTTAKEFFAALFDEDHS